jgi:hypothetical protein
VLASNQYVLEGATQTPVLKSLGKLDNPNCISQNDECVTAMMTIPPDEIMPVGQVYIANQSNEAQATKRIDAWKYYRGYNHVLNFHKQSMDRVRAI